MSEPHTYDETLGRLVERIEDAEAEKRAASDILRGIYNDAKDHGFEPALLRQIVKERRTDPELLAYQRTTLARYRSALGMLADTPLGEAALRQYQDTPIGERHDETGDGYTATVLDMPRPFAQQPVRGARRPRKGPRQTAEEVLGA